MTKFPSSAGPDSRLPSPLPHLQILHPPAYDDLVPLSSDHAEEGSVICVDARTDLSAVLKIAYEQAFQSYLARICRYCPCVLLVPTDTGDLIRTIHSRPFLYGFRALLVPGMRYREVLREALTDERSLPQGLATWILVQRSPQRLDLSILNTVFSLSSTVSLQEGLFRPVASADTVAMHLARLGLPPASRLRMLGLAVRASMRLQRNPDATIESVASSLGYASGAAVSLLISRKFGVTTREVRDKLGWEWLMGRWEKGLAPGERRQEVAPP